MPDITDQKFAKEEVLPEGMMRVTRQSRFTGNLNTMDLPVTPQQLDRWYAKQGLIQDIFPDLNSEQREFLMTGCTPEEWAKVFPPEDEEG